MSMTQTYTRPVESTPRGTADGTSALKKARTSSVTKAAMQDIQDRNAVVPTHVWAEPDDAGVTVLGAIMSATKSVDIVIYELGGPHILQALQAAKRNGVNIRVILNGQFFVGNSPYNYRYDQAYKMKNDLEMSPGKGSVDFHWASNNFNITHQKTILIDAGTDPENMSITARALVMSLNLSAYGWGVKGEETRPLQFWADPGYPNTSKGCRDFGVVLNEPVVIARIMRVFNSDFKGDGPTDTNNLRFSNDGLVWSNGTTGLPGVPPGEYPANGNYPYYDSTDLRNSVDQGNARAVHKEIIRAAKKTLLIYNEEMEDEDIVNEIKAAAGRSVKVRILMTASIEGSYYRYDKNFTKIAEKGKIGMTSARIRLFPETDDFMYIHAKMIVADHGQKDAVAFVGSQNFSGNSLNFNRELGVILKGKQDMCPLVKVFEADWKTEGLLEWPTDGTNLTPPKTPKVYPPMKCGPIKQRNAA